MKYEYLKKWVEERSDSTFVIEKIVQTANEVRFCFVGSCTLRFVNLEGDFFPFIDTPPREYSSQEIWQIMKNATWTGSDIEEQDRIIKLSFETVDIYQEKREFCLIAECILPQPNLILCKVSKEDLIIIDAIRKYSLADNPQRQVLPHLSYYPPKTAYKPVLHDVVYPLQISNPDDTNTSCYTMNDYLKAYFYLVLVTRREQHKRKELLTKWQREFTKLSKKISKQEAEKSEAAKSDQLRIIAETLKTNLHSIKPGDTKLITTNYFDPDMAMIEIPLDASKNPVDNMRLYMKKYQKAKKGYQIICDNIKKNIASLNLIDEILNKIKNGEDIGIEIDSGIESAKLRKNLSKIDKLLRIKIDTDWEIVIGRKATENDLVTTQLGKSQDWWFHTRIYHGSHILLRNFHRKEVPALLIEACCSLAAWYSKARFSLNVPVDYTQIRYVRKPRKSAPGFVTYTNHATVFSTPKDLRQIKTELGL